MATYRLSKICKSIVLEVGALVLSGYVIARDMMLGRVHRVAVHSFDDCNDDRSTGTQRAVPLRLGPQVQTVLPREGQRGSERRTEGGGGIG